MDIGTKLVADTTEAKAKRLYCGVLTDGQVYTVNNIFDVDGIDFFTIEGIENHQWSIEPDRDGDSHKQFFKLLEV